MTEQARKGMTDEEFEQAYGLSRPAFIDHLNALPEGAFWDGTLLKWLDELIAHRKAQSATPT